MLDFFDNTQWLTNLTSNSVAIILLVAFALFYCLERLFPHRKPPIDRAYRSYRTNFGLFIVNNSLLSIALVPLLFLITQRYSDNGLLSLIDNPIWRFIFAFILLDFLLYLWHRVCHSFDNLWVFHRVHHNDANLNTSTALRIHIIELAITNLLKAGYIIALGVDQITMLANELLITLLTLFHHANVSFYGEKWLAKILIVPSLHRTHHSTQRHEHDSNYGTVFSIWDRLFKTLNKSEPAKIGLNANSVEGIINLLKMGFNLPTTDMNKPIIPANLEAMIAEAAYYRAEKRNFSPGNEMLDWLEAKNDIFRLIYGNNPPQNPVKYGLMSLT